MQDKIGKEAKKLDELIAINRELEAKIECMKCQNEDIQHLLRNHKLREDGEGYYSYNDASVEEHFNTHVQKLERLLKTTVKKWEKNFASGNDFDATTMRTIPGFPLLKTIGQVSELRLINDYSDGRM